MKLQYLIKSRYNLYSVINQLTKDTYIFIPTPGPFRILGDNTQDIEAVDPSGGPMIRKGDKIFDFEIEQIYQSDTNLILFKIKNEIN